MGVVDAAGLPLAVHAAAATPHELTLVAPTLLARFVAETPRRLMGDRAYDSDPLDRHLAAQGIALIAPHKANRRKAPTQDGRVLRRSRRRWKTERWWA